MIKVIVSGCFMLSKVLCEGNFDLLVFGGKQKLSNWL